MAMKLVNGDYVKNVWGGFETVSGVEEILDRVLFKLNCRRGGFAPMPELGSRLYLLGREKIENLNSAARQYILEALTGETEIAVSDVTAVKNFDGSISVKAEFNYLGENTAVTVTV